MPQKIPLTGLIIVILIVSAAFYLSTLVENPILKFAITFIAVFFVVSAFIGLYYEGRVARQIIKAGYLDVYIKEYGVGNQKTFKAFIESLKKSGYSINPQVEKILWEEIKKRTGYAPYQTSVR